MKKLLTILILLFSLSVIAVSQDSMTAKSRTFDDKVYAKNQAEVLKIVKEKLSKGYSYISIKRIVWAKGKGKGFKYEVSALTFKMKDD